MVAGWQSRASLRTAATVVYLACACDNPPGMSHEDPDAEPKLSFDQALGALLALVGERVEVHVMDAGETPHLAATFAGVLLGGYSTTGGEPGAGESIFVRIDAGSESASLILDREVYRDAIVYEDGASMSLQMGTVELTVACAQRGEDQP